MPQYDQALGIVIRSVDFSETSKVVTLFTREYGKLGAMAKGARRAKGSFEGSLDVLSVCRIGVIRKPSADLDLLTEARLEERFAGLGRDLQALYAGFFAAELLDALTQPHDPHPALFDAATAALRTLDRGTPPWLGATAFALAALGEIGYGLALDACCGCGAPADDDVRAGIAPAFAANHGGLLCGHCRRGQAGWTELRPAALRALRALTENGVAADAAAWPPEVRRECWRTALARVQALMGRASKTAKLLAV